MTRRTKLPWMLASLLMLGVALAGCGTPDEQEADESPASEQEAVGEGEVPGFGAVALILAAVAGAFVLTRIRR